MKYDKAFFDTYVERRGTRSIKWDGCNAKFGVDPEVEMLPMWIADTDFKAPAELPAELERNFKITDAVMRFIVIRKDEK